MTYTKIYNEIVEGEKNPIFNISAKYYKYSDKFIWLFEEIAEEIESIRSNGGHVFIAIDPKLKPTQVKVTTNPDYPKGEFVTLYFHPSAIVNDDAIKSFKALAKTMRKEIEESK